MKAGWKLHLKQALSSCTHVTQPMQQHPIVLEAGKSQYAMIQWHDIVGYQRACMVGVSCSIPSNNRLMGDGISTTLGEDSNALLSLQSIYSHIPQPVTH